ncbi:gas vesicle protein GvpG [Streptomyces sp. NPDC020799]|uniref:gas vesicle protein GvpG n=1 Tax=Streptomyces sp. NPDC020799 TaxID=3365091 RepID=UPI00379D31BB
MTFIGWVLRQVLAEAERIHHDPATIRAELKQLEARLTNGLVDKAEFDRQEDALLDRLEEGRRRGVTR